MTDDPNPPEKENPPRPARRTLFWLIVQLFWTLFAPVWFRFRARGTENIPKIGSGILISNHQSYLDPMLISFPISRSLNFLARDSLLRNPFMKWVFKQTRSIPISRESVSTASFKAALRCMRDGNIVGIFPEGTRTCDGNVDEFKPGFVALVRRGKVPVYPVGIAGAHLALPRNAHFLWPKRIRIVYGKPISLEELKPFSERGREEELVALIRDRVVECHQEAKAW